MESLNRFLERAANKENCSVSDLKQRIVDQIGNGANTSIFNNPTEEMVNSITDVVRNQLRIDVRYINKKNKDLYNKNGNKLNGIKDKRVLELINKTNLRKELENRLKQIKKKEKEIENKLKELNKELERFDMLFSEDRNEKTEEAATEEMAK